MYEQLEFENCKYSKDPIVGCALEGVASIVAGIRDVSIVIHSPQGCAATVASAYDHHEMDFTKRKVACTRLFESDIVMGASEKLKDLIKQADATFDSKVMFVVGTCASDIIGEDLVGICHSMQSQVNAKLIPVIAGGFHGNSYDGIDLGLNALLPFVHCFPDHKIPNSVNIIAPQANSNPTWWADLQWVTDTLNILGITVQTVLSHDVTLSELDNASLASANILLSHDVGYEFAKRLCEALGIPLILSDIPLPVGLKNTARWLNAIGSYFDVEEQVADLIQNGEAMVVDILRRRGLMIIPRYRNCKVALSVDATLGIGLVRMLFEELEMIPEVILFRSDREEARALLEEELKSLDISPKVAFGVDGYQIKQALEHCNVDAVLGSSWERYLSEEAGIKLCFDLLSPTNRVTYLDKAYFGYQGMLNMLEQIGNDWEVAFRSKEINWTQYDTS
ncbi:MAG: nitrogenase associated protein N [Methanothrix sp.]|nr:nitrogenase associated protein N [Methanothrix sp.]